MIASGAFWLGFSALITQVVLLREIYSQAGGTDIIYGFALGSWLVFGGMGVSVGRKAKGNLILVNALFLTMVPASSVLAVLAVRGARGAFGILPGEIPSFGFTLALSSFPLILPAASGGASFACLCAMDAELNPGKKRPGAAVFAVEAIGSAAAGIVTLSEVCVKMGSLAAVSILLAATMLFASLWLLLLRSGRGGWSLAAASVLIGFLTYLGIGFVDRTSVSWSYPGFRLVGTEQCERGRLDVVERGGERFFFYNLERVLSENDVLSREEAIHLPASFVTEPKRFLILGASGVAFASEAMKYGDDVRVSVFEGDEIYGAEFSSFFENGFYELLPIDPVDVRRDGAGKYQVIFFEMPLPVSLSSVRFSSPRFLRSVSRLLKDEGVVYVRFPFGGEYLTESERQLVGYFIRSTRGFFDGVRFVAGERLGLVLSLRSEIASQPIRLLKARLGEVEKMLEGFRTSYLVYLLDAGRLGWLKSEISGAEGEYAFPLKSGLLYALAARKGVISEIVKSVLDVDGRCLFLSTAAAGAFLAILLFPVLHEGRKKGTLFFAGASGIFAEVVTIFSYQLVFGDVYLNVGMIFCAYMIGLSGGAILSSSRGIYRVAYAFGLLGTLGLAVLSWRTTSAVVPEPFFYIVPAAVGWGAGGFYSDACERSSSPEMLYAFDLIGASAAAFASPVLIASAGPYLGASVPLAFGVLALILSFAPTKGIFILHRDR